MFSIMRDILKELHNALNRYLYRCSTSLLTSSKTICPTSLKRPLFCKLADRILSLFSWEMIPTAVGLNYMLHGIDKIQINFSWNLQRLTAIWGFIHVPCLRTSDVSLCNVQKHQDMKRPYNHYQQYILTLFKI